MYKKYLITINDNFSGQIIKQFLALGEVYDIENRKLLDKRVEEEILSYYEGVKGFTYNQDDYDYEITHLFEDEVLDLRKEITNE